FTDATIFFAHKRFKRSVDYHGIRKVLQHFPEYESFQAKIEEAELVVEGSRETRLERKASYERLATDYIPELRDVYERFERIDALKVPDHIPEKLGILDRNVTLLAGFNVIVGIVGIVSLGIAIWAGVVGFHTDQKADRLLEQLSRIEAATAATTKPQI